MTSSESQPRTRAGRELVEDEPRLVTGEHSMLTRVLAIEAEAAQDSLPSPSPEPPPGTRKGKEWGEGYSEGWFDASAGSGLAAFFDWAARSPHYSCSMEDEPEGTSRGLHLWHIYRKYHGAAQPAPDLDVATLTAAVSEVWGGTPPNWAVDGRTAPKRAKMAFQAQAELIAASYTRFLQARESGGEP